LAKTLDGDVVHVRNLDFGHRDVMQKLVHYQDFKKGGSIVAEVTGIAGYYGVYTGRKPGLFSISYNVRESTASIDPKVLK